MKSLRFWFSSALVAFGLALSAHAEQFEGHIEMTVTSGKKKESVPLNYTMKGEKMRMDMKGAKGEGFGGVIFDMGAREIIILMENDGQKNFMRQPLRDVPATEAKGKKQGDAVEPVATGRTENILGYPATEYKLENKDKTTTTLWLAKGLGTFFGPGAGGGMGRRTPPAEWEKIAREGNLFPMRVITTDAKGNERDRMEVTKIDKGSVSDSVFSTAGYTELKIPGLGAGALNPFKR